MGTMSKNKLAGWSLILGPTICLICYFIQQLGIIGGAEWGNAKSIGTALTNGGALTTVISIVIPLGLGLLLYGFLHILNGIRGNGNGDALASFGLPFLFIGSAGFMLASGTGVVQASYPEAAESLTYVFWAIGGIAGMFFTVGFSAAFFAMGSRDEYNSTLANANGLIAAVAFVLSVIGLLFIKDLNQITTQIVGVTYVIHTIYAIILGRGLIGQN